MDREEKKSAKGSQQEAQSNTSGSSRNSDNSGNSRNSDTPGISRNSGNSNASDNSDNSDNSRNSGTSGTSLPSSNSNDSNDSDNSADSANSANIEEILRERDRLEQILREKFEKEVVILFTDICGYTMHIDMHGDVSGLALIQRHNQIILPIIEKHAGLAIKTIGDAVMVSFSNSLNAVKAGVAIQNALHEYNRTAEANAQIHVKIGINIGQALVDKADIHGDVVNVASRIQAQAGPDQILISNTVYEQVRGIEDILCRFHGTARVKGKAEPLELYRVVWRDEDIVLSTEPKVRASRGGSGGYEGSGGYGESSSSSGKTGKQGTPIARGNPGDRGAKGAQGSSVAQSAPIAAVRLIQLEVTRQETRLKISINERMSGEESTLRNYEEVPVSMDWIKIRCHEMVETLNEVNRQGRFSREVLLKLRATGRVFYHELLTPAVKAKLRETKAEYLRLNIDDQLVQVPWELLYDGQEFLCQRFNMGRLVKTRHPVHGIKTRVLARPLRMLIITDPSGNLDDAYQEGIQIQEHLAQYGDFIHTALRSQDITPEFIKEKIKYFDLVHFAGHADYDQENPERGGWSLTGGTLTAQDVIHMAGSATQPCPMPSLIFSNACQSARTEEWVLKEHFQDEIFGLAHAFLMSGVKHYVGTFWEILDEPGRRFALEFYKYLLSGLTAGEAMRQARLSLIRRYGEETAVWASYLLYGDPTFNYLDQIKTAEEGGEKSAECCEVRSAEKRGKKGFGDQLSDRLSVISEDTENCKPKTPAFSWQVLTAAGVCISLLILILFMLRSQSGQNSHGCQNGRSSQSSQGSQGNQNGQSSQNSAFQSLSQGQVPVAILSSQSTGEASLDSDFQKSMQLIHLLSSYQDRLKDRLMETRQQPSKGFFTKEFFTGGFFTRKFFSGEFFTRGASTRETSTTRSGEKEPDTWTSSPLSIGMILPDWERIDLKTARAIKPSFDLLCKEMIEAFTRTHALGLSILERERLAAILQELQIGLSPSAATDTEDLSTDTLKDAYRILSARVILFPEPVFYQFGQGIKPQISLRLVETKSTRITAAFSVHFSLQQPESISQAAADLVNKTVRTLQDQYPLQGRILSCNDHDDDHDDNHDHDNKNNHVNENSHENDHDIENNHENDHGNVLANDLGNVHGNENNHENDHGNDHDHDHDVEINLGSEVGILKNQSFTVLSQMKNEQPKGTIRIKSVYEHTALAEVLNRQGAFVVGDRVKAVSSGR
jgi:class 3 adenylate cyclase/CHAT domain-containing protein